MIYRGVREIWIHVFSRFQIQKWEVSMVHIGVYRIQIQDVYLSPLYTLHDTLVLIKGVSFSLFEFLPRKAAKSSP